MVHRIRKIRYFPKADNGETILECNVLVLAIPTGPGEIHLRLFLHR